MSLRSTVNRSLERATGYRLVRAEAVAPPVKKKRPPKKPATGAKVPVDYDQDTREILELVRERTMTGHPKIHFLVEAVRYAERHAIPGAIVECGVWRGGSMLAVAHTLLRLGRTERELYMFDTYSGMSVPTERDVHRVVGAHADDVLAHRRGGPIWQVATLEDVQDGFAAIDYPDDRLHFVPGKVEETIPGEAPEQIAILRLDTDWYESTKHELVHLYRRLAPGGVLIIDDYGSWQGSKDATDEFLDETGEPILLHRIGRGRAAVKPGLASRV